MANAPDEEVPGFREPHVGDGPHHERYNLDPGLHARIEAFFQHEREIGGQQRERYGDANEFRVRETPSRKAYTLSFSAAAGEGKVREFEFGFYFLDLEHWGIFETETKGVGGGWPPFGVDVNFGTTKPDANGGVSGDDVNIDVGIGEDGVTTSFDPEQLNQGNLDDPNGVTVHINPLTVFGLPGPNMPFSTSHTDSQSVPEIYDKLKKALQETW